MDKIIELRGKLCKQLEEYPEKELTSATLDVIDKLTHTIKNLDKIIDREEGRDYSNAYDGSYGSYGSYGMYDPRMMSRTGSYARGGNTRRDSMGRYSRNNMGYSRNGDIIMELTDLMDDAPDDRTRMEIQKCIQKMQNM